MALRCKVTGCDLNACGICRRCGDESKSNHEWQKAESTEPCSNVLTCERCDAEKKTPRHDWGPFETPAGESGLRCTRCNLVI